MRANSGFYRPHVLQRPEHWGGIRFIGLQKNAQLQREVELAELALAEPNDLQKTKQRIFCELIDAAKT